MKAEERKELKTNTLVSTLERVGRRFREGPSRRTMIVIGIGVLALILIVTISLVKNANERKSARRWGELMTADKTEDLGDLADKNASTDAGRAARLQLARAELRKGTDDLLKPAIYNDAVKRLKATADEFEKLAKDYGKILTTLEVECLMGAAEAREAVGDTSEAVSLYEQAEKRAAKETEPRTHTPGTFTLILCGLLGAVVAVGMMLSLGKPWRSSNTAVAAVGGAVIFGFLGFFIFSTTEKVSNVSPLGRVAAAKAKSLEENKDEQKRIQEQLKRNAESAVPN